MKKPIIVLSLLSLTLRLLASPLPQAVPILTAEALSSAANDVPVAKIDFSLPGKKEAAEASLEERFFNQPDEHRYSGITNADWSAKWQLFANALVVKARRSGFDANSLEACLRALNRGRNRQTMLYPMVNTPLFAPGTPDKDIEVAQKEADRKEQELLKERDKHPEQYFDDSLVIIPVGAYLARHPKGDCWVIVCKWEMVSKDKALPLGHIKVWALDTKTAEVVGYVTCD